MRTFPRATAALGLLALSCVSYLHQYIAFGKAPLYPETTHAVIGDIVTFEVRPAVPLGSVWSLECRDRVRFADDHDVSSLDWVASPHAVRLETVVSPWDPVKSGAQTSRAWLWYGLRDEGESTALDSDLPIARAEYKQIAPVTIATVYAPGGEKPELTVGERAGRAEVKYRTPTVKGIPRAPSVDAMLVESEGRTILYAEVRANFGNVDREPVGYEATFSYDAATVHGPVEIVVVGWTGREEYWKPFFVTRYPSRERPASAPAKPSAGPS